MLEDTLRQFKAGYNTSRSLLEAGVRDPSLEGWEGSMAHTRNEAFIDDCDRKKVEFWEALGYIAGGVHFGLRHPVTMYRILRS